MVCCLFFFIFRKDLVLGVWDMSKIVLGCLFFSRKLEWINNCFW